jgi:hypothetical protein
MKSTLEVFTQHLDLSQNHLDDLLSKSLNNCLNSPEIQQELGSLDSNLLKETLPIAGNVLAENLPLFYHWLKNELGVKRVPDSPNHTTKWVIGFLNNQESLTRLVELHRPVPRQALESSTSRLVGMFDGIKDARVRQEWQKAIAILCLIIIIDARDTEKVQLVGCL